jgi:ubiquinone/menaquinone biosynthesis C-methylase UbiE
LQLRQKLIGRLRAQFGRPTGLPGRMVGWLMAYRSSNRRCNAWVVSLLDVQRDDRVLEIGFGPGIAIRELARRAADGRVCGIDHSEVMLRQASRRNAHAIRRGVVDLRLGSVDALPDFDAPFDNIMAVNALLLWNDPDARLRALARLLRPGAATLARAGFSDVRVETMRLKPAVVCALGPNGASA